MKPDARRADAPLLWFAGSHEGSADFMPSATNENWVGGTDRRAAGRRHTNPAKPANVVTPSFPPRPRTGYDRLVDETALRRLWTWHVLNDLRQFFASWNVWDMAEKVLPIASRSAPRAWARFNRPPTLNLSEDTGYVAS